MGSRVLLTGTDSSLTMGKGQNEGGFSQDQLDMYKDCFKLMDINKDGTIDKNDLRGAFDNVGVLMSEGELDGLLGEISGPCNYDNKGKIDVKIFQHALKPWGDKMSQAEIDDVFGEFDIDEDYMVKTKEVLGLFVAQKEEKKEEAEPEPVVEAAPEPEEDEGAKKKKKKKKKAAK